MSLTMNNVITTIYMQTYASIYTQFWLGAEVPVILKICFTLYSTVWFVPPVAVDYSSN